MLVSEYVIMHKGADRGSTNTGKSAHNQIIERLWRNVFDGVLKFYNKLLYFYEDIGILDVLNDVQIQALYYVFLPVSNKKLEIWNSAWCHHCMRTARAGCLVNINIRVALILTLLG